MKTRITELLGIEYPIIQGGLHWLSWAELAAAVSNAGGLGTITAATHRTKRSLVEEIRKTKALTDRPFGVNITMLPHFEVASLIPHYVEAVIEEGVPVVETSGGNPEKFVGILKDAGVKVIHKVASVKYARKAESMGVDAVTVVGFECGGHPGNDDVTTMILIPKAVESVNIPVLAAGGIVDARGFVAALSLGAEGVVMGTRFVATRESVAHPNFKQWMLDASETDTVLVKRSLNDPVRVMRNRAALEILELERRGVAREQLQSAIHQKVNKSAMIDGEVQEATYVVGQGVGLIREVKPVREVIEEIINEARVILDRLQRSFN